VGVTTLLLLTTLGFSKWYAPFGWIGWGPRLLLPWIPASILLLLYDYADVWKELLSRATRYRYLPEGLACAVGLASLPNFRALLYRPYPGMILHSSFCKNAVIQLSPARYYDCIDHLVWPWPDSWQWLILYYPLPRLDLFAASVGYAVIIGLAFRRTLKLLQ
jgi:hypothetical protein